MKADKMAKELTKWISNAIDKNSKTKKVIVKKIFEITDLMVPIENDRSGNPWKKFFKAFSSMKNNAVRNEEIGITNQQFKENLEGKLLGFPNVDLKLTKKFIDQITINWKKNEKLNLHTDSREIRDIIVKFSASGAKDISDLCVKELKMLKDQNNVLDAISILWNKMVNENVWPIILKHDRIVYIFKNKGERFDPSKYRPITIVNGISKIFEELLRRRISIHLPDVAKGLNHAYKIGLNCQTAVFDVDQFIKDKELGWHSCAIFIDLRGAYESVEHRIIKYLIQKKSDTLANLTHQYVAGRKASITNNISRKEDVILNYRKNRSIPQGSIVSPWVFRQYCGLFSKWLTDTITLSDDSTTRLVGYADDHVIIVNAKSIDIALNTAIKYVEKFKRICECLGVAFAPEKTEILLEEEKDVWVMGNCIRTSNLIVWLGYSLVLNRKSNVEFAIQNKKKFTLVNNVETYCRLNSRLEDRKLMYMMYIKCVTIRWFTFHRYY